MVANKQAGVANRRRNANGQGSIWWDEKRQRYVGQISVYDSAGKLRRRTVTARTQAELDDRLDQLRLAVNASPTLPAGMTVARFLTYWLDDVLPTSVRPGTIRNYSDVVRLYIDPAIGRIELAKLTPSDVRSIFARMNRHGQGPNTQRLARTVLRRALRTAEADELVTRNVAAITDGIRVPKPRKKALTDVEGRLLLEVADAEGWGALVAVLLGLGLRRGEACGLQWSDVHLDGDHPTLTVAWQLAEARDGSAELTDVKENSERTLPLPAAIADRLRRHRAEQNEQRLVHGPGWGRGWPPMVFASSVGTPLDPDRVTRLITELADRAGVGHWTPHGLRHSAVSILHALGVPLKDIAVMAGHSSIRVTGDIYTHVRDAQQREVAATMQRALFD